MGKFRRYILKRSVCVCKPKMPSVCGLCDKIFPHEKDKAAAPLALSVSIKRLRFFRKREERFEYAVRYGPQEHAVLTKSFCERIVKKMPKKGSKNISKGWHEYVSCVWLLW